MRKAFFIVVTCLSTTAMAQTPVPAPNNPPAQSQPNNNAVNSPNTNNAAAPVAGANSFTEAQAKTRIEAQGFTSVSGLQKDNNGVWRGKAMKDGKSSDVSLDLQGNFFAR